MPDLTDADLYVALREKAGATKVNRIEFAHVEEATG